MGSQQPFKNLYSVPSVTDEARKEMLKEVEQEIKTYMKEKVSV